MDNDSSQTTSPNTESAISATDFLKTQMAPEVIAQLLKKLKVPFKKGAFFVACHQAQEAKPEMQPVERMQGILSTAKLSGLQPVQLLWQRFDQRRLPALVCFRSEWVLVERTEPGKVLLTHADDSTEELDESSLFGSLVLWVRSLAQQRQELKEKIDRQGNVARKMVWRALFKEPHWLMHIILATLVINFLAVATSLFAMQVYDRVVPTLAYATLWTLIIGMLIVFALDWLLKVIRSRILDSAAAEMDKRLSQQVFDHVMQLQLDQQPKSLGTLASQIGGLDSVRQFFSSGIVFALVDLPFVFLFIAFIAVIGGVISWVYMLLLPVALLLGFYAQWRLKRLLKEQLIRVNERQGLLVDAIQGSETIRANNATWRFSEEWQAITHSISTFNLKHKDLSNLTTTSTGSLSQVAYISAIAVGVVQIEQGNLTMGGLIACTILGGRVIGPVANGVRYLTQWQQVAQSLDMVNQVLMIDTERRSEQDLLLPEKTPEKLELEKVRFSYPEAPIQKLNIPWLSFNAGDRVLLLGPIGCGKSTLLKVLAGLYRPTEGRVRLGDADLWEIDPQVVATYVGYLPQSAQMFKGSLKSNLALSGAVSDSRLLQIIHALGIESIAADSPQGLNLEISEGGEGLSLGQRQLVALGRVMVAQPKIWLLDEPSASLDGQSEAKMLQALESVVQPQDIVLIATHRPLMMKHFANRVIVMRGGEVVKDGQAEAILSQLMQGGDKRRSNPPQPMRVPI